jgi:acetyl-CoA carboxylase biotin carboxyl carrier protein
MNNIKLSKKMLKPQTSQINKTSKDIPGITPEELMLTDLSSKESEERITDKEAIDNEIQGGEVNNTLEVASKELHYITAPLVGTFYSSPKAEDPPFIKKGDKIEIGQTICIIEAMKIFNEIESEVTGIIDDILIKDTAPVEYGQKIISIKLDD